MIFNIPEEYLVNMPIDIKTFLTSDLTLKEKKRFKEIVLEVTLKYQVTGEEIPSLINEDYDCQVILFFEIKLRTIKDASFVAGILNWLVKAPCVLRCHDHTGSEVYSYAHKRLSKQDRSQVVIEDIIMTSPTSQHFEDEINTLMRRYIAFDKLKNRVNKLNLYLEMMIKSFIISNLAIWSGNKQFLVSKVWYNLDEVLKMFELLKAIKQMKVNQKSAQTIAEQSRINTELKKMFNELSIFLKNELEE